MNENPILNLLEIANPLGHPRLIMVFASARAWIFPDLADARIWGSLYEIAFLVDIELPLKNRPAAG